MIRSILKNEEGRLVSHTNLPSPDEDPQILWLEVKAPTDEETESLRQCFGIDLKPQTGNVIDDDQFLYLRSQLVALNTEGHPIFRHITFALSEQYLITLCDDEDFHPFAVALQRCNRKPSTAESPKALLRVLLQVANDNAEQVIDHLADALEQSAAEISAMSENYKKQNKALGLVDLAGITRVLNAKEELISRCLEAQLSLARTARYLNGEVDDHTEIELQSLVTELVADIAGVKEHAAFEHDKVRYLQNAVTHILNIKENQIVKVFTIITAVFLPPTLVGTFYGMNFSVMPELSWEHGFIYSMLLTLTAAVLPLVYIKYKGWLR